MKKVLIAACLILMCVLPLSAAEFFEYIEYQVTDNLRLRTDRNTSAAIITTIQKDSPVTVIAEDTTRQTIDGITSVWVKVSTCNNAFDRDGNPLPTGTEGWVFGGYLALCPEPEWVFSVNARTLCEDIVTRKSLSELSAYISKGTCGFPFNILIPVISQDWKQGFDYIMGTEFSSVLASQCWYDGKYEEIKRDPFETNLYRNGPNCMYYGIKLLDAGIDVNTSVYSNTLAPLLANYLTICNNTVLKRMLLSKGIKQTYEADEWISKVLLDNGTITLYDEPFSETGGWTYTTSKSDSFKVIEASFEYEVPKNQIMSPFGSGWVEVTGWAKITDGTVTGWAAPGTWALPEYYWEP